MNLGRYLSVATISVCAFGVTFPAQAALTGDVCRKIAETGAGVYDRSLKNGSSVADAESAAQKTVIRRVHEESGATIKTMEDAINTCVGAGVGLVTMCAWVRGYYIGKPC